MKQNYIDVYLKEKEPTKYYKSYAWKTAIGLQMVDGLETSEYLIKMAHKNINGEINFDEVHKLLDSYYKENSNQSERVEEADKVSARIAQIISDKSFVFSPVEFISIHKRLFEGIYSHAGQIRQYNISKEEWILDGDTVIYGSAINLRETLEYDFSIEKEFDYSNLSIEDIIKHLARFVSNLWQIHIFGEGNTRTVAVFLIKYLTKLGFEVTNDIFSDNAWYFRNSLVRANYNNRSKGINETTYYLELFLKNLLNNEKNILSNRELHISYNKIKIINNEFTSREMNILEILKSNPKITLEEISIKIGKSVRTIKIDFKNLQERGIIERIGGKKNGSWKIINLKL